MKWLGIVGLAIVAVWFWESPVMLPLRLLVVLFHEGAHALAAWATGGEVVEIAVRLDESGHTLYRGGWPLIVGNAGYLGSLAVGLGLVFASRGPAKAATVALGVLLALTMAWMPLSAGLLYTFAAASGLVVAGWKGTPAGCGWLLRGLGVFSVLYAVVDVQDDAGRGDAAILAASTGVPAIVWTGLWLAMAGFGLWRLRGRLLG